MFERPTATYSLGLEVEGSSLRGALLTLQGDGLKVERLFSVKFHLEEGGLPQQANPLVSVTPPLPRGQLDEALIVTGFNNEEILVRSLEVKLPKPKDVDSVLLFQAEPLLPFPLDNAVIDRQFLGVEEGASQLTVFATRKDRMQGHLDFYHALGIEPEAISCYPAALAAFAKWVVDTSTPIFVLHLAGENAVCLLAQQGNVVASHALTGISGLLAHLPPSPDFTSIASSEGHPAAPLLEALRLSVGRTLYALTKQNQGEQIPNVLVTGEGALLNNLGTYLCESFNKQCLTPKAIPGCSVDDLVRYAIPIGLAQGGLSGGEGLNFRQAELAYPNPWKRLKKPIGIYFLACLGITLLIFLVGQLRSNYELHSLRDQFSSLLLGMGKDYQGFEEAYHKATQGPVVQNFNKLSASDLQNRVDFVRNDVQNTPLTFPLQPNTPRVSDILAWIASHPKARIQIESFSYNMVKRPDKSKPKERYQVRVEMEFSSPDAKLARDFYDALVAPNDFVDPKGEVKWTYAAGKYRISFFLKDKTFYP